MAGYVGKAAFVLAGVATALGGVQSGAAVDPNAIGASLRGAAVRDINDRKVDTGERRALEEGCTGQDAITINQIQLDDAVDVNCVYSKFCPKTNERTVPDEVCATSDAQIESLSKDCYAYLLDYTIICGDGKDDSSKDDPQVISS